MQLRRTVLAVQEFIRAGRPIGDTLTEVAELGVSALGTDMAGLTLTESAGRPKTVVYTDQMVPRSTRPSTTPTPAPASTPAATAR